MSTVAWQTMVVQFMMSLEWRNIVVLHNDTNPMSSYLDIAPVIHVDYDVTSASDAHLLSVLGELVDAAESENRHHLNIMLLCPLPLVVNILQQMEAFDAKQNSSFDLRHSSSVMVVVNVDDLELAVLNFTTVENLVFFHIGEKNCQNVSTVSTLVFSPTGRHLQTVELNSKMTQETVFPNLQYGYNRRTLTVVMKPYLKVYGFTSVDGMKVATLEYLVMEYLTSGYNFSVQVVYPREDEWGRNVDGKWTGVLGMLQRKVSSIGRDVAYIVMEAVIFATPVEADLAAERLSLHEKRLPIMDFLLPPLLQGEWVIMYKREGNEDYFTIYLRPFSLWLFLLLLGTLLLYSLFQCLIIRYSVIQPQHEEWYMVFLNVLWKNYQTSLRQASDVLVSRSSERVCVAVWWMFITIVSSIYCNSILASLTVRVDSPPFTNLAQLTQRYDYTIGYDGSSFMHLQVQHSNNPAFVQLRKRMHDIEDEIPLSSDQSKHYAQIDKGKYAFIEDYLSAIDKVRRICEWTFTGKETLRDYMSFAVPKHSPYRKDFEKRMQYIGENGIFGRIEKEWLRSIPEDRCPVDEFPAPISAKHFYGVLTVVTASLAIASLTLCGEVWFKKCQNKDKIKKRS